MQTQEEKETSPLNKEWECWAMLCKISYALRDVASHLPPSSLLCVLLYLCPIYLDIASGSTLARLEQSFLPHSTTTRRLDSLMKELTGHRRPARLAQSKIKYQLFFASVIMNR